MGWQDTSYRQYHLKIKFLVHKSLQEKTTLKILITNDDGIYAEGLWHIAKALEGLGDIYVVAPDRDMSGVGTAMTISSVLRTQEFPSYVEGVKSYVVQGTPSDSVILATEAMFDEPFDVLVSGINPGANLGLDVFGSGTVGAALQGYYRNIPSIAISSEYTNGMPVRYDVAALVGRAAVNHLLNIETTKSLILNLNLPDRNIEEVKGVQFTTLGPKAYMGKVEKETVGRRSHYWIKHHQPSKEDPKTGTDVWAIRAGQASITIMNQIFGDEIETLNLFGLRDALQSAIKT